MKRSKTRLARVCWAAALAGMTACGQAPSAGSSGPSGAADFGLQLSPGTTVTQGVYTISGPNGFFSAGNVAIGESADLAVPLDHLPIGTGYTLNVSALASDGLTSCDGSTIFDVTNTGPLTVTVHLVCAVPSGDAAVTATFNVCPMIDSLSASPTDVRLGGTVALTSSAHDSDLGPSPLSYKWTINGAALNTLLQPNLNFACTALGTFNFTLSVSDGDITPGLCRQSVGHGALHGSLKAARDDHGIPIQTLPRTARFLHAALPGCLWQRPTACRAGRWGCGSSPWPG